MNGLFWRGRSPSRAFAHVMMACLVGLAIALLPQFQLILFAAIAAALLVIAAIFTEPIVGLGIALIVGPLQPLERVTLQLPLDSGQIVLAVTLIAYSFRWLATRRFPILGYQPAIAIPFASFVAVCLLSFFPARDFRDWATECIKWLQIGAVALLVGGEHDERKRWILISAILISTAGQAIFGLIQADVRGFGPSEFRIHGTDSYRAYGTFEQPNPFGGWMGLTWPFAAAIAAWAWLRVWPWLHTSAAPSGFEPRDQPSPRDAPTLALAIVTTLTTALCLMALNASGSRGALIGAGAAVVTIVLALLGRPWQWAGAAIAVVLALFAFDVVNIPPSLEAQLQAFDNPGSTFGIDVRNAHVTPITFSTIERLAHWQAAIRMIEASPWLGVGFGNYAAAYAAFRLLPWENALGHAHNYYLNIFAETGVIGLLFYLALWATIIIVTWRATRREWRALPYALCIGILGAWAHLTVHHVFDKLYVANMHLLIGTYLGLVIAARVDRAST